MKVKNLTPFPFGTKVTSRRPPRPELVVVVRATYLIAPGQPLALPEGPGLVAQGPLSAERYRDEDEERAGECLYPGDFADWKARAEVMLRGTCHTPRGEPLGECPVRFEVGRWSKILRVVGRRFWSDDREGAAMSAPAPFTKMPLGHAQAFGGPGYARNPVGKGVGGQELPNVEHAGAVIRSRRDDPGPAGFGPVNPSWPARQAKLGRAYDARWRRERWPYYAEDLDWSYFQAAPEDQRLDGYLRGDEALLFQNLHPSAPVLEARLPGLRVRTFLKDARRRFREVPMSLDTLFADLDEGKLYLTWRGLDAIEADDMKDVETALIASERLDEAPLPEGHYRGLLEAFEADPLELKDRAPPGMLDQLEEMQRREKDRAEGKLPAHDAPAPDPMTAALREQLDSLPLPFAGAREMEQEVGRSVAMAMESAPPKVDRGGGPAVDIKAKIAEAAAGMKQSSGKARSQPAIPLRPGAPPPAWAARGLAKMLAEAEEARKQLAGQSLPREAAEAVKKGLAELDAQLDKLRKEPFFKSILDRPAPQEPGPYKDLSGQDYEGRDLGGADLRGANLRDANLAGANLRGAKLSDAILDGAVLVEADLSGADLTGADLTLANCTGVKAPGAILRGATLTRTFFQKADLSGATLEGARGQHTFLPEANLEGAALRGAVLDEAYAQKANLAGADLSGATLTRCHFLEASAQKLDLSRATLTRTSFLRSDLREAIVIEAKGDRSVWMEAKLDGADFTRAALPDAVLLGASAARACFRRAILKGARWYRASLEQADFTESNLLGADFSKCRVAGARFTGANLYDAKFLKAAGEGCDFTGANLKRAMMGEP